MAVFAGRAVVGSGGAPVRRRGSARSGRGEAVVEMVRKEDSSKDGAFYTRAARDLVRASVGPAVSKRVVVLSVFTLTFCLFIYLVLHSCRSYWQ
jgi:endonuclease V-like protein UPF0215 family